MRPRSAKLAVVLLGLMLVVKSARAQVAGGPETPGQPIDCVAHPRDPRCHEAVHPAEPVAIPVPEQVHGPILGNVSGGSCGGGGGNGGVAILAAAVVAAAFLPVVVYLVDDEASPEAQARWSALTARPFVYGGTITRARPLPSAGFAGARLEGGYQLLGVDASFESGADPTRYAMADADLVLRLPPRDHVELGLALGAKQLQLDGRSMTGFEISAPHRYLFGSAFAKRVALEVRPSAAFNASDLALMLEGGVQVPLPGPVSLRLGGRVWSFNHEIEAGALGGMELEL